MVDLEELVAGMEASGVPREALGVPEEGEELDALMEYVGANLGLLQHFSDALRRASDAVEARARRFAERLAAAMRFYSLGEPRIWHEPGSVTWVVGMKGAWWGIKSFHEASVQVVFDPSGVGARCLTHDAEASWFVQYVLNELGVGIEDVDEGCVTLRMGEGRTLPIGTEPDDVMDAFLPALRAFDEFMRPAEDDAGEAVARARARDERPYMSGERLACAVALGLGPYEHEASRTLLVAQGGDLLVPGEDGLLKSIVPHYSDPDEWDVHLLGTRFLDPAGPHCMGDTWLRCILEEAAKKDARFDPKGMDLAHATVRLHCPCGTRVETGHVDALVECGDHVVGIMFGNYRREEQDFRCLRKHLLGLERKEGKKTLAVAIEIRPPEGAWGSAMLPVASSVRSYAHDGRKYDAAIALVGYESCMLRIGEAARDVLHRVPAEHLAILRALVPLPYTTGPEDDEQRLRNYVSAYEKETMVHLGTLGQVREITRAQSERVRGILEADAELRALGLDELETSRPEEAFSYGSLCAAVSLVLPGTPWGTLAPALRIDVDRSVVCCKCPGDAAELARALRGSGMSASVDGRSVITRVSGIDGGDPELAGSLKRLILHVAALCGMEAA